MTVSPVSTVAGPSTTHKAVAGTVPLAAAYQNEEAEMKQDDEKKKQQDEKMNSVLEKLVDTQPLQGSAYKFISRCKKCGWQTMQQDQDSGKKLVTQHAQSHWPEIQAAMAAAESGGGQPTGSHPGTQKAGSMSPRTTRY